MANPTQIVLISIHAPSRERLDADASKCTNNTYFNPRSLAGATMVAVLRLLILANFNPRSLTGTTFWMAALALISLFQSSLPHGSDV